MRPEGKGLGPEELGALLHFAQSSFTCLLVLFSTHLNIIWRVATAAMFGIEGTIASIKNIHFRIVKLRILINIDCTIFMTNEFGPKVRQQRARTVWLKQYSHDGSTMCRVLAVKYEKDV